ncbi:MAG: WD40 repeat domain-containing protein, partial [Candidatus Helarchaeota archaeon]
MGRDFKLTGLIYGPPCQVYSVALTIDGKRVISGLLDSRIMIWDLMELKLPRILRGHLEGVNCI